MWNNPPFKKIPTSMIIKVEIDNAMWHKMFLTTNGTPKTIKPRNITPGLQIMYNKNILIEFGYYSKTHKEHDSGMGYQTIGASALQTTDKIKGGN